MKQLSCQSPRWQDPAGATSLVESSARPEIHPSSLDEPHAHCAGLYGMFHPVISCRLPYPDSCPGRLHYTYVGTVAEVNCGPSGGVIIKSEEAGPFCELPLPICVGDERRRHQQSAETLSDASSGGEGGMQDFVKTMSRFAFFRSVKVRKIPEFVARVKQSLQINVESNSHKFCGRMVQWFKDQPQSRAGAGTTASSAQESKCAHVWVLGLWGCGPSPLPLCRWPA